MHDSGRRINLITTASSFKVRLILSWSSIERIWYWTDRASVIKNFEKILIGGVLYGIDMSVADVQRTDDIIDSDGETLWIQFQNTQTNLWIWSILIFTFFR